jgi:hypothetical protein
MCVKYLRISFIFILLAFSGIALAYSSIGGMEVEKRLSFKHNQCLVQKAALKLDSKRIST